MKKILFIDRDGTIIEEPKDDYQIDSLEKLQFIPKVITSLAKISKYGDFDLIMVSNQDGLGTDSFPEETFWPAHNKMIQVLKNEDIIFQDIHIDPSFPHENSNNRKPGTGMLEKYIKGKFDVKNSFVIGDRLTDVELARNLGSRSILFGGLKSDEADLCTDNWDEIYKFLVFPERESLIKRKTKETDILIRLNLDGTGISKISTGLNFFDHMLEQISKHGNCDLEIMVKGDLEVDEHHTIEDTALALGEAFREALGNKKGVSRYGFLLPMDEALAHVALDFGGRPWVVWDVEFKREKIGDVPTEMFYHFFKSFTDTAKCNLNVKAEGKNEHHIIEAVFKGFAKSIKMAVLRNENEIDTIPSTKGSL
jgi:imidazoleglycerol-phosphate dehydratase/histidinol-phosphatase